MQRDNIIGTLHTDERVNGGLSPRERLTGYGSVGGGVSSYNELEDLPTMNGHTIEGDLTPADLDIWQPKDFSTTEQNTGIKWIDDKYIYQRVYDFGTSITIPTNGVNITSYVDNVTSIDKIIFANAVSEDYCQSMNVLCFKNTNDDTIFVYGFRNDSWDKLIVQYTKN